MRQRQRQRDSETQAERGKETERQRQSAETRVLRKKGRNARAELQGGTTCPGGRPSHAIPASCGVQMESKHHQAF